MARIIRVISLLTVCVTIMAVTWTYRYRYEQWNGAILRINRVTGRAEMLAPFQGWIRLEGRGQSPPLQPIPASLLPRLDVRCLLDTERWTVASHTLKCSVYNGSDYDVRELTLGISEGQKTRPYRASGFTAGALSADRFDVSLADDILSPEGQEVLHDPKFFALPNAEQQKVLTESSRDYPKLYQIPVTVIEAKGDHAR